MQTPRRLSNLICQILKLFQYITCQNLQFLIVVFNQQLILQTLFARVGSEKKDFSDQLNNGNELKKPCEGSLQDSHVFLNSSAMEDIFVSSLKVSECLKILLKCMKNVQNQMKKIMYLTRSYTYQIKEKSHLKELQESVH